MQMLNYSKLFQAFFLVTIFVSGTAVYAMEDQMEEKNTSSPQVKPAAWRQELSEKLEPYVEQKIGVHFNFQSIIEKQHGYDLINTVEKLSGKQLTFIQARVPVLKNQIPTDGFLPPYLLTEFIKIVKDLPEQQWHLLQERTQTYQGKMQNLYEFIAFMESVKDLTEQQWISTQVRIQPLKQEIEAMGNQPLQIHEYIHFINAVKDVKDKEWSIVQPRILDHLTTLRPFAHLAGEKGNTVVNDLKNFILEVKDLSKNDYNIKFPQDPQSLIIISPSLMWSKQQDTINEVRPLHN